MGVVFRVGDPVSLSYMPLGRVWFP
jgi:hypothetical protein